MPLLSYPPSIHTAFNPAYAVAVKNNEAQESEEITVVINFPANGLSLNAKRYYLAPETRFDLSMLIKSTFADVQERISPNAFVDGNLCIKYTIQSDNSVNTESLHTAINAAAQIGQSADLTTKQGTFCTSLQRLSYYDGYPLTATAIGHNGSTNILFDNAEPEFVLQNFFTVNVLPNQQHIAITCGVQPLETNDMEIVRTNRGEIIYVQAGNYLERRLLIDSKCLPPRPFYVRWINQHGGWDYFMFSHRQTVARKIESQRTFSPLITDPLQATATEHEIYKEGVETITVGATNLTAEEFGCVSRLPYSPKIEFYDKAQARWFGLIVDDSESEEDTREHSQSIEFSFKLPNPQLQF